MANLLTYPALVEAPFIKLTIGDYTFGTYIKSTEKYSNRNIDFIQYPNFVDSMEVVKINGAVNQYTIRLIYQVEPGADPNLMDKILSKVGYGTIKISYGDWATPSFIFKEEEALITKTNSNFDFANSRITYTISCTSNALSLLGTTYSFGYYKNKPSTIIKTILANGYAYGLFDAFTGMKDLDVNQVTSLIDSDDMVVEIEPKPAMDVLSYLNYLTSCMIPISNNTDNNTTADGIYVLTIHDNITDSIEDNFSGSANIKGTYFTVKKISTYANTLALTGSDVYTVDIGYPGTRHTTKNDYENLVSSFTIRDENSWALLYKYSDNISFFNNYVYSIDNEGNLITTMAPNIMKSDRYNYQTPNQKSWWTEMTSFPVSADLNIKGLVRAMMLTSYVKINTYFYGQRHISSGLYIVTGQRDTINSSGYKTSLSLLRIGGDDVYNVDVGVK